MGFQPFNGKGLHLLL